MILKLEHINKQFPGVKALSDMNFDLNEGEVHALLGENGAGKSTLIKIIAGAHKPDSGNMYIGGEKIEFNNTIDSINAGIGVVFQEISVFPNLSIMENMFIGRLPKNRLSVDYKQLKEDAKKMYKMLNIEVDVEQLGSQLSIADRQMLAIAKALSLDSKILILDEPTAALSAQETESLFSIVRNLKKQGVAIIFISHRMEELYQIADRVTVMRDGQYIGTKIVSETNTEELVRMMVGRTVDNFYPKEDVEIGDVILEANHLSDESVVKDVSFQLKKGEILGVSGLAGAGRTETMTALVGLTNKTGGEVIFKGQKLNINNYKDAMKFGMVYVSEDRQNSGLTLHMSVKDNSSIAAIARFSKNGIIDRSKEIDNANEFIEKLSIAAPYYNFAVENLSGGNQQKVSVAKALSTENPEILIFDEPTRGVDVGAKAEIHGLISSLAKQGMSIILISSELPEIIGMSDRVLILCEGKDVGIVEGKDIDQEIILSKALGEDKNDK